MITLFANNLSSFFVQKTLISAEEKDTYTFCFEVLISSTLSWTSLIVLAFLAGIFKPFLYYIFWFCLFRNAAGGYHAASHLKCYLLSILTFLIFLVLQHITSAGFYLVYSLIFSFVSVFLLLKFAPVDHPNNPFTEKERIKHTFKIRLFILIYLIVQCSLFIFNSAAISFNMSLGCLQAALSVAAAYYLNYERRQTT